jgi:AcrR family transcriptional regulator
VTDRAVAAKTPYHHGDLRTALVAAATELAREGGPNAIVLRETARRVGVSQTAAYRHFSALPDLVEAVADAAQLGIAASMQEELDRVTSPAGSPETAVARMAAVGRGYVLFALAEPGLYATAFAGGHDRQRPDDTPGPYHLLQQALGDLISVGLLDPSTRQQAAVTAWAAVHGLSSLLLGPMRGIPADLLGEFIDSCLRLVAFGLLTSEPDRPDTPPRVRS